MPLERLRRNDLPRPSLTTLRSAWLAAACCALLGSGRASAHGADEPIPYPDEESPTTRPQQEPSPARPRAKTPRRRSPEPEDTRESYARLDDPYFGIAAEARGGLLLLESSRGAGAEPRFGLGVRATWEAGRAFENEAIRDILFLDLAWAYTSSGEGTTQVRTTNDYHYLTLAPAVGLLLSEALPLCAYLQAGAGLAVQATTLRSSGIATPISGTRPLFQYGAGLRLTPALGNPGSVRLSTRLELTRFRRGYMDDTLLALGVGVAF